MASYEDLLNEVELYLEAWEKDWYKSDFRKKLEKKVKDSKAVQSAKKAGAAAGSAVAKPVMKGISKGSDAVAKAVTPSRKKIAEENPSMQPLEVYQEYQKRVRKAKTVTQVGAIGAITAATGPTVIPWLGTLGLLTSELKKSTDPNDADSVRIATTVGNKINDLMSVAKQLEKGMKNATVKDYPEIERKNKAIEKEGGVIAKTIDKLRVMKNKHPMPVTESVDGFSDVERQIIMEGEAIDVILDIIDELSIYNESDVELVENFFENYWKNI